MKDHRGGETVTGRLPYRLTHHVNILEMNGGSYRLKRSRQAVLLLLGRSQPFCNFVVDAFAEQQSFRGPESRPRHTREWTERKR